MLTAFGFGNPVPAPAGAELVQQMPRGLPRTGDGLPVPGSLLLAGAGLALLGLGLRRRG